jgi:exodeoxyribonuclease-3
MLVSTLNLNGLRSAARRGFRDWLDRTQPDVLCLQEVRALQTDIPPELLKGWTMHWNPAQQKGYAGTAILTRLPGKVTIGCGHARADEEGRVIGFSLPDLDVWSIYFPSGSSGPDRQAWKMEFLAYIRPWLDAHLSSGRPTLICGDINICHTAKDIKNAKPNEKNSGFLPEERAWLTDLFSSGWQDIFRVTNPDTVAYSWWSNRGRAYENDVGWRIDQQWATPGLNAEKVWIDRDASLSDHAPVNARIR